MGKQAELAAIQLPFYVLYTPSTLLLETLLNNIAIERVAICDEETTLQERRRVVNLVFLCLYEKKKVSQHGYTRAQCVTATTYALVEL